MSDSTSKRNSSAGRADGPDRADPASTAEAAPRGDATREALIRAAIDMFGRDGFNATGTRAISEAAGVNQALIGYHFGGKPGLYLAALKYIADSVVARIGPLVARIEAELDDERGIDAGDDAHAHAHAHARARAYAHVDAGADVRVHADAASDTAERAIELLHEFTGAFAGMLSSEESKSWARLILREQQDPSEGFELLYAGIMRRMLGLTTRLVARARHSDASSDRCRLTALTIIGQALVFRVGREAVLRQMGWDRVADEELDAIKAELRRNVTAILRAES